MVEAVGVEPTSEKRVPQASPCAVYDLVLAGRAKGVDAQHVGQPRVDDPGSERGSPNPSIHFSGASSRAVDRAHARDVAVN